MNLSSHCKNSQTLNGTCTCLQVQRVSTVQSSIENMIGKCYQKVQLRSVIDKGDANKHDSSSGLGSQLEATYQAHNANIDSPDKVKTLKQQSNKTQCSVMHSGLWSKETH